MPERITCPKCQAALHIPAVAESRQVCCPRCQHVFESGFDPDPVRLEIADEGSKHDMSVPQAIPLASGVQARPGMISEPAPGRDAAQFTRPTPPPTTRRYPLGWMLAGASLVCVLIMAGLVTGWLLYRTAGPRAAATTGSTRVTQSSGQRYGQPSDTAPTRSRTLPPLPSPVPIEPPDLNEDRVEKELGSAAADLTVGGAGRYFILHLPKERKLAVFDVNVAKVVQSVPVADESLLIAAGMNKLLIAYPASKRIERWDLTTFVRETTAQLEVGGKVQAMAMGSASSGPLLIYGLDETDRHREGKWTLLDIRTLQVLPVKGPNYVNVRRADEMHMRASPDGAAFVLWSGWGSPLGEDLLVLEGDVLSHHDHWRHDFPGISLGLPAHHGPFTMSLEKPEAVRREEKERTDLCIHLQGAETVLARVTNVDPKSMDEDGMIRDPIAEQESRRREAALSLDKRIHLIPAANLVLILHPRNDRLILCRLDIAKALQKYDIPYLFVLSQPLRQARRGGLYSYQLDVKSREGQVRYRLDLGPEGMSISPEGLITWQVPADWGASENDVVVLVQDASGKQSFHTFQIIVGDP